MAQAVIHAPDLMRRMTLNVKVTGKGVLAIRLWVGTRLILLAAHVMGCGIEIEGPGGVSKP